MNQKSNPSRRAVIGTIAAAPAAAVSAMPGAALASPATAGAFQAALARYRHAKAASTEYEHSCWEPAFAKYEQARAAIPHAELGYDDGTREMRIYSTASRTDVAIAQAILKDTATWAREAPGYVQFCGAFDHAVQQREAKMRLLYDEYGLNQVGERLDTLEGEVYASLKALIECPAGSVRQIGEKMEVMEAEGHFGVEESRELLAADVRRIGRF